MNDVYGTFLEETDLLQISAMQLWCVIAVTVWSDRLLVYSFLQCYLLRPKLYHGNVDLQKYKVHVEI